MEELVDEIIKRSKSILGVQEIIYSESEKKLKIESTEVANVVDELEILSTELSNSFDEYSKEKNKLKQKYIEKRIIDVFLFKSIFNKNVTTSEDTFIVDIQSFHKFVENLVELASSAYEQRMCTSSFILVKFEEEEVEKDIEIKNIEKEETIVGKEKANLEKEIIQPLSKLEIEEKGKEESESKPVPPPEKKRYQNLK